MGLLDTFGIPWTDSQREALDIDINTAVTAGAGSGKTQVLSARYLLAAERLLTLDQYHGPEHILVLTFTDKAAAEMKERIGSAISDYLLGKDFNLLAPSLQERWQRFRSDLPVGEISTIHSFCSRILRQYPVEAGLDPEFSIIEGYEQKQLLEDTIRGVITRAARDMDSNLAILLKMWSTSSLVDVLKAVALSGDQLSDWFDRYCNRTPAELERDQRALILRAVERELKELDTPHHASLVAEIANREALRSPAGDSLQELRSVVVGCWQRCMDSLGRGKVDSGALSDLVEALCRKDGLPRSFGRVGLSSVWGRDGKEYVGERLRCLSEAVSSRVSTLRLGFEDRDTASIQVLKALATVGLAVLERFQRSKDRAGVLDFSDLEIRARSLITEQPRVRAALARRYRYVMVDEFQDTNGTQWDIIRSLCMGEDGESFAAGKLFLVGDEKQAIYSFRGGDVTTFAKARRELAGGSDTAETGSYRRVVFEDNFRSCEQLVCSFNFLFSHLLESGDVPDYEAEFQHMVKANERITQDGWAAFHLVEASEKIDHLVAEAEVVAGLASDMASDNTVKGFAGDERPLVAILLRRMSTVKVYESALRRYGLEFSTVKGRGFFQQQEVLDLFNLLAFLSDSRRDIELFGALRSPIFALSDEDIVAIIGTGKGSVWDRLRLSPVPKAARCRQVLDRWRGLRDRCAVARLIRHVMVDSGSYAPLAYGRRGKQRLANVEKLIGMARSSDASGKSLAEFVAFLERQMEDEEPEGEAEVAVESPIVLMTIHQAKGLQFPAVIVPDLSGRFNMGAEAQVYIGEIEGSKELGVKTPDPASQGAMEQTALRSLIRSVTRRHELAEQKRLLYVGATRAQLLLSMVGLMPSRPIADRNYQELNCWCEWLWKACDLESIDRNQLSWHSHSERPVQSARTRVGPLVAAFHRVGTAQPCSASEVADTVASAEASAVLDEPASRSNTEVQAGERLDVLSKLAAADLASDSETRRSRSRKLVDLSATAAMDYVRCPRLFYLRHRMGVPELLLASTADPGAAETSFQSGSEMTMGARVGDLFHRLVAHEVYEPGDPRIEAVVGSLLPPSDLRLLDTYVETVNAHLSGFRALGYADRLRSLPSHSRRCEVELDLVVESTDEYVVRFTGFIDMLVSAETNRWRILDFKTNALAGQPVDVFTREHLYDLQMELYMAVAGLALCRAGRDDTIEKAEIVYTSAGRHYEVDPNPGTIDRLLEIAHLVYEEKFGTGSDEVCESCAYQVLCRP